jgi:hypothetical protein
VFLLRIFRRVSFTQASGKNGKNMAMRFAIKNLKRWGGRLAEAGFMKQSPS